MICVKFTAFCDLRADLRIRLATLRKSVRKFWFCKLALTCVNLRVRLARGLRKQARPQINQHSNICLTFLWRSARSLAISFWLLSSLDGVENRTMLFRQTDFLPEQMRSACVSIAAVTHSGCKKYGVYSSETSYFVSGTSMSSCLL